MKLREKCLACRRCGIGGGMVEGKWLANVFSNMNCVARMMVVGQNPGRDEAEKKEPFIGTSGKFFDEALASVGMSRSDCYVSNAVRCYTPGNRKPLSDEMDNCRTFLDREIEILKPKLLVALGGTAFKQLTGLAGITKHHGTKVFSPRYKLFVIPLLHPSPLNMNKPENREEFLKDMQALKVALDEAK